MTAEKPGAAGDHCTQRPRHGCGSAVDCLQRTHVKKLGHLELIPRSLAERPILRTPPRPTQTGPAHPPARVPRAGSHHETGPMMKWYGGTTGWHCGVQNNTVIVRSLP